MASVSRRQSGARWSWLLASPVFVASIVMLVLNDHVLKHMWPGMVTGKLSDVAGVVMLATVCTAILRRPAAACASVGLAFALLKTVPSVAVAATPILGGRTLTDTTDVVAVLALIPLYRWMTRAQRNERGSALVPLKVLAVVGAALATSATSCYEPGAATTSVVGDRIYLESETGDFQSEDGGRTWEPSQLDRAELPFVASRSNCGENGVCFELTDRGVDRVDPDGNRTTDFVLTEREFSNLGKNVEDACSSRTRLFRSVGVVDAGEGDTVVVAMGEFGALHRDVAGTWSFVDVGEWTIGDSLTNDPTVGLVPTALFLVIAALLAVLVLVGGIGSGVASARRGQSTWFAVLQPLAGVAAAGAIGLWILVMFAISIFGRPHGVPLVAVLVLVGASLLLIGANVLIQKVAPTRRDHLRAQPPGGKAAESDINTL